LSHVSSLVRQHQLFSQYSSEDPRVAKYLRAAGHYEFGPQRVPVNVDASCGSHILAAWNNQQDADGYAAMWAAVYAYVRALSQADDALASRIMVLRYEDFCARPRAELRNAFDFCQLADGVESLFSNLSEISAPAAQKAGLSEEECTQVWIETREVAEAFGYTRE
jgi:hypothetical protein